MSGWPKLKKVLAKLGVYLFWNGTLRLLAEAFFEIMLLSVLNLHTVDWRTENASVEYSNILALFTLMIASCLFAFVSVFYLLKSSQWQNPAFQNKYGSIMLTVHPTKNTPLVQMMYPLIFLSRRLIFTLSAVIIIDFLWMQFFLQFTVSVAHVIYLMWYYPLEDNFTVLIEVFNECICIMQTYFMMLFTDFVPSAETRNDLSFFYVSIIFFYIAIHVYFLVKDFVNGLRLKLKQMAYRRKLKQ